MILIDYSPNPTWLTLATSVRGFAQSVNEFKTADTFDDLDGDGSLNAVFGAQGMQMTLQF